MTMDVLKAALMYAGRGWPVFPTRPDKTPLTKHGVMDATTSEKKIREWFTTNPFANVAIDVGGAGMMVLDLDPGHDVDNLEAVVGKLPATQMRAKTPRGGEHLFFRLDEGEVIPPSVSKLSAHVDVRSFNSYVLVYPSRTHDGVYEWECDPATVRPAHRTDTLAEVSSKTARMKSQDRDNWIIEPDIPENVASAVRWLKDESKIAVEGLGGDATAYATAAYMKSLGISQPMASSLMWEHWNPRCDPPWPAGEWEHFENKIENAYAYNTSPPGNLTQAYRAERLAREFQPVQRTTEDGRGREMHVGRFRFADRHGVGEAKSPSWLLDGVLQERSYGIVYGAPGSFKSFITLDMALAISVGPNWPWTSAWTPKLDGPGTVLYVAGEGRAQMMNRIKAWEQTHNAGKPVETFYLADPVPMIGAQEDVDLFVQGAMAMNPDGYDLVVIDTIGRGMMGLNENSQEDASKFTHLVERIQYGMGDAAVLAVHHVGKDTSKGVRGSTVFQADADVLIMVEREGKAKSVRLTMTKQKDAEEWPEPLMVNASDVMLDQATQTSSLVITKAEKTTYNTEGKNVAEPEADKKKFGGGYKEDELIDSLAVKVFERNKARNHTATELIDSILWEGAERGTPVYTSGPSIRANIFPRLKKDKESVIHRSFSPADKKFSGNNLARYKEGK